MIKILTTIVSAIFAVLLLFPNTAHASVPNQTSWSGWRGIDGNSVQANIYFNGTSLYEVGFQIENPGNTHWTGTANITVRNPAGAIIGRYSLPGQTNTSHGFYSTMQVNGYYPNGSNVCFWAGANPGSTTYPGCVNFQLFTIYYV